jgi:hypothetical protein
MVGDTIKTCLDELVVQVERNLNLRHRITTILSTMTGAHRKGYTSHKDLEVSLQKPKLNHIYIQNSF